MGVTPSVGEEIVAPFPAPIPKLGVATEVRSTLLASSFQALRARGHYESYLALLPAEHRAAVLDAVAGTWLPIAIGLAHYRACDALELSAAEQFALGAFVADKIHGTFLEVAVRAAKHLGVTPWTILSRAPQLLGQSIRGGGGTQVTKLGGKEARLDLVGIPMLRLEYYVNALRGLCHGCILFVCERAHVQTVENPRLPAGAVSFRIAWL